MTSCTSSVRNATQRFRHKTKQKEMKGPEMAMCLRDQADPGGHCPALTPLLKRQRTCRYGFQSCLEHQLMQLVRGQPQTPGYRADCQPSPALAHQLYTETCETWLRWPTSVFPDDVHALRVVFACLCTSIAQRWSNQQSTAWDHLLQTIAGSQSKWDSAWKSCSPLGFPFFPFLFSLHR